MLKAVNDWMCFWLKGEIPSDPERAARWAIFRKQQDEVLKTPPAPKGHWQFVRATENDDEQGVKVPSAELDGSRPQRPVKEQPDGVPVIGQILRGLTP